MRLDKNIKYVAILVHSPPEVVTLPFNRDKDLIQVPRVTQPPLAMPQLLGEGGTLFHTPLTHGFVTDRHPAIR
jgi:hypothetical protein